MWSYTNMRRRVLLDGASMYSREKKACADGEGGDVMAQSRCFHPSTRV